MGDDKRTKIEEIGVAIIFAIMLVVAICFSLDKSHASVDSHIRAAETDYIIK